MRPAWYGHEMHTVALTDEGEKRGARQTLALPNAHEILPPGVGRFARTALNCRTWLGRGVAASVGSASGDTPKSSDNQVAAVWTDPGRARVSSA